MRIVKKNVYYCDYCNKKGLRSLKIHEKHCTANPDRDCRLCDNGGGKIRRIIEKYQRFFEVVVKQAEYGETITVKYLQEFTLEDIRLEIDYQCPNCILAIIRCVGLNRWYFGRKFSFNYKKELEEWWSAVNEEENRRDHYGEY